MDHQEAIQSNTLEKYILGELSADLREQFEAHYFDCPECAENLKSLSSFVSAGRICFEEANAAKDMSRGPIAQWSWLAWLKPAIAAPAILVLAAVILFQAAGTIPPLKEGGRKQLLGQIYQSSFRLQGRTRGETSPKIAVRRNEAFALDFDFIPARSFPDYKGNLIDPSGHSALEFDIRGEEANKQLYLVIPGDELRAGSYELVFTGQSATQRADEVLRLSFHLEFKN
jgi:hypothetical protein